jgi:hypothetical protein
MFRLPFDKRDKNNIPNQAFATYLLGLLHTI